MSDADTEADAAAVRANALSIQFQTQETVNWCGPSSTRIALSALRAAGHQVRGLPDQRDIAIRLGAAHADGSDTGVGTDEIDLITDALNWYLGDTRYRTRRVPLPPTPEARRLLRQDLVADIDAGYPIVANVISGWRPWGYPVGRKVRHYVTVIGYSGYGDVALVADPAYGLGGSWQLESPTYQVPTDDLATWVGSKGYAA